MALGPLTNVARVLERDAPAAERMGRLVMLGGTLAGPGNVTPTAEFNIYCDPPSARAVYRSTLTKAVVPLDAASQLLFPYDLLERIPSPESRAGRLLRSILPYRFRACRQELGLEGAYLHDAVGLCMVTNPELFTTEEFSGDVELAGELTTGMTIFDRRRTAARRGFEVVVSLDVQGVKDRILAGLSRRRSGDGVTQGTGDEHRDADRSLSTLRQNRQADAQGEEVVRRVRLQEVLLRVREPAAVGIRCRLVDPIRSASVFFGIAYMMFVARILGIDPESGTRAAWWAYEVVFRVLVIVPFLMKDGFAGYSPGKALCGVRAMHERTGQPIGFFRSLGRNLPLVIPIIPLVAGLQLQKGYRIGDKRVGTKVIWTKYARHPMFHVGPGVSAEEIEFLAPRPATIDDGNPYRAPMG